MRREPTNVVGSLFCTRAHEQEVVTMIETDIFSSTDDNIEKVSEPCMLDMNCKPIVISCDHGYGNCKSSNIIFPTGIEHVASKPVFPADVLEWNGKLYIIG